MLNLFFDNFSDTIITDFHIYKIENKYYLNQSTNIQTELLEHFDSNKTDKRFNLEYYINSDFDYFTYFFDNVMYVEDYGKKTIKNYKKYSVFNGGDKYSPTRTLFKGIEYELYNLSDTLLTESIGGRETIKDFCERWW